MAVFAVTLALVAFMPKARFFVNRVLDAVELLLMAAPLDMRAPRRPR